MKKILRFKLLGNPMICLGDKEIYFSFAKINALLFYLLINGSVSREEAAGLLWENKDNQTAKKNLRNTIYQANKILGDDFIICPNRSILNLNPKLPIKSDVLTFKENPVKNLTLYEGRFLKGFYLKDSEQFDLWLLKMRAHFEQMYIKACHQRINEEKDDLNLEETESNIRRLIEIDEFDEKNYQLLMQFYQTSQRTGKVIETYYELVNLLDRELGVEPSEDIRQIYHEVLAQDKNEQKTKQFLRRTHHLFGRVTEIEALESYFSRVLDGQDLQVFVLSGDTGVGKRTVIRQVLANQIKNFQIITTECFRTEMDSPLRPWRSLLDGLESLIVQHQLMPLAQWHQILEAYFPITSQHTPSTITSVIKSFDINILSQLIVDILHQIAQKQALVLLIEDSHWMDKDSLKLLQSIANHLKSKHIALILTKQLYSTPHLDQFLSSLTTHHQVEFAELRALTKEESFQFVKEQAKTYTVSEQTLEEIYRLSQGNAFLLSEYSQVIRQGQHFTPLTPAIQAKIAFRLDGLKNREVELLNYIACFRENAPIQVLAQLLVLSIDETIEIIEALQQKHILIEEHKKDEIGVAFKQTILQIYVYEGLSLAKKRMLHGQIAQAMAELLSESQHDIHLLEEIVYHYQMAKQLLKSLEYSLDYLKITLRFQHELFPIYSRKNGLTEKTEDFDQEIIQQQFDHIRHLLNDLESQHGYQRNFQQLSSRFLYLEGRYYIRTGQYQKGIDNIQRVIATSKELRDMEYLLEGYRQIIYYCIQVENIPEMRYYTELALEASVQANNHEAIAITLRLKGLYHLMVGEMDEATRWLKESIDSFSLTASLKYKYSINIAAALDYLSEIEQIKENYQAAIHYQKQAIALTENKTAEPSTVVFYIGLGISYYLLEDYERAELILLEARAAAETVSFPWKEAQLEVFLALINFKKKNYQPILDLLSKKEELMTRYSSPRDKGIIYYLMAVIKYHLETKTIPEKRLHKLLNRSFEDYYEIAKTQLNPYRDRYQLYELEALNNKLHQQP